VTTTEAQQITDLARQGLCVFQIADKLGRARNTVKRHLQRAGLWEAKLVPKAAMAEMVRMYLVDENATLTSVAAQTGWSIESVRKALRLAGVEQRPNRTNRKWSHDAHVFDSLDNEEAAYWLYFLLADGHVVHQTIPGEVHYALCVGLCADDRGHLEKLRQFLKFTGPITDGEHIDERTGTTHRKSLLRVYGKPLVERLVQLGIVPHDKSYTAKLCPEMPERQMRHAFRGLLDGDGCISAAKKREGRVQDWDITVTGTRAVVEGFHRFLLDNGVVTQATPRPIKGHEAWNVAYGGTVVCQAVVHLLYDDAVVYLDRKMKLARQIMAQPVQQVHYVPEDHQALMVQAYTSGATLREAAAPFGYSTKACLNALIRAGIPRRKRGPQPGHEFYGNGACGPKKSTERKVS
jgi:hypothetical protein